MGKLSCALGILAGAVLSQSTSGAVIEQTSRPGPPAFSSSPIDGFDSSLGTLTSVDIIANWNFKAEVEFDLSYGGLGDRSYPGGEWHPSVDFYNADGSSGQTPLTVVGNGYIDPFAGKKGDPVTAHAIGRDIVTDAAELSFFKTTSKIQESTGSFPVYFGETSAIAEYPEGASVEVAYEYTPASAVPEPSAWALMICGIGGTGFALRGRKQLPLRRSDLNKIELA